MTVIISQVAILVLFGLIGFILSKARLLNADHSKILSTLLVYVFLPANSFRTFATKFTVKYIKQNYSLILISIVVLTVLTIIAHLLSKILTKEKYKRCIYKYSIAIPTYAYMGYALAESIFGSDTLLDVMLFDLPLSIYVYTIGYCMLTKTPLKLKNLINPTTIALLLGMIVGLSGLILPNFINTLFDSASAPMGIVGMLLTGITISQYKFKDLITDKTNYIVILLRLLVLPLSIAYILKLFISTDVAVISLLAYAMPCGLNTVIFPKLIGEDCRTGASLAMISTILSPITIIICLYLFT